MGSFIYGTILGIFIVAFYLKRIGAKAVFAAAAITEIVVCICGYTEVVAYLWLNLIGCFLVVIFSLIFQFLLNKKAAGKIPTA